MKARTLILLGLFAVVPSVAPGQPLPVPSTGPPAGVAGLGAGAMPLGPPRPALAPNAAWMQPGSGLPVPAPVVAAKFLVPKDVRVTAYPGSALAHIYDATAVFGLRPGYVYRFELSNLPFNPGKTLYPEVEVRGVLVPRPGMKYMDYALPLAFSADDIEPRDAWRGADEGHLPRRPGEGATCVGRP